MTTTALITRPSPDPVRDDAADVLSAFRLFFCGGVPRLSVCWDGQGMHVAPSGSAHQLVRHGRWEDSPRRIWDCNSWAVRRVMEWLGGDAYRLTHTGKVGQSEIMITVTRSAV